MDEDLLSWPPKPITSKELKDLEKKTKVKDVDELNDNLHVHK